ncbi:hypothetical protein ABZW32_32220 [Streptomyces sp. NPDC004667]|uniref:hypothetical protein n=1 Tax=Streptomyces sp. NPDC004667 TaxID=3154285 RepID=UPI0033AF1988
MYRPSTQTFYERDGSGGTLGSAKFGNPGWTPLTGDFNGDGTDTIGAYDPVGQKFYLTNYNSTVAAGFVYGNPGDIPITGAW